MTNPNTAPEPIPSPCAADEPSADAPPPQPARPSAPFEDVQADVDDAVAFALTAAADLGAWTTLSAGFTLEDTANG